MHLYSEIEHTKGHAMPKNKKNGREIEWEFSSPLFEHNTTTTTLSLKFHKRAVPRAKKRPAREIFSSGSKDPTSM
jgi:hypothetical protein